MRTVKRPRRYVQPPLMLALRPLLRYSSPRDAYVLHFVGRDYGPVLRVDRRAKRRRPYEGEERRESFAEQRSRARTA